MDKYLKNFQNYKNHFFNYENFRHLDIEVEHETEFYKILSISKKLTLSLDESFLIIPSVINDLSIFLIGDQSFAKDLSNIGQVFIVEWLDFTHLYDMDINDYVKLTVQIIEYIKSKQNKNLNIIGHCLGGIFSIAACHQKPEYIKSLMLIATPWDFSHFKIYKKFYDFLKLHLILSNKKFIPATYLNSLFYMMDIGRSFKKFFNFNQSEISKEFFAIERWLYSTNNICKKLFNQLMIELIEQNVIIKNQLTINEKILHIKELNIRILNVMGIKNKITPPSSSIKYHGNNIDELILDTGHIGAIIGRNKNKAIEYYKKWLKNI